MFTCLPTDVYQTGKVQITSHLVTIYGGRKNRIWQKRAMYLNMAKKVRRYNRKIWDWNQFEFVISCADFSRSWRSALHTLLHHKLSFSTGIRTTLHILDIGSVHHCQYYQSMAWGYFQLPPFRMLETWFSTLTDPLVYISSCDLEDITFYIYFGALQYVSSGGYMYNRMT